MGGALRILQVGELRLDEVLEGEVTNLPDTLQTRILNAKYLAAETVFAAAVSEQVDLVLITGAPTHSAGGRRPYWFLLREFEQLKKHGIKVVCAETSDHFSWPEEIQLPDNVHVLTRSQSIGFRLAADLQAIEIEWEAAAASTVCATQQGVSLRLVETAGKVSAIRYATNVADSSVLAEVHSIQAQTAFESGPFCGTLVQLDSTCGIELSSIRTEAIRWERIELNLNPGESQSILENRIDEQISIFEKNHHRRPETTLATVVLRSSPTDETAISNQAKQTLFGSLQRRLRDRNSSTWLCRIEQNGLRSTDLAQASPVVQVALEELNSIKQADVYDNLDLHVLEIEPHSFERTKSTVALRLSSLLDDGSMPHRRHISFS